MVYFFNHVPWVGRIIRIRLITNSSNQLHNSKKKKIIINQLITQNIIPNAKYFFKNNFIIFYSTEQSYKNFEF